MSKIIRTPTMAKGGVTEDELRLMSDHSKKWIANAFKTGRTDVVALADAIRGLYRVSGLDEPIVVVVPSPIVMALAGGIASQWWNRHNATYNATANATRIATRIATRNATDNATFNATDNATRDATVIATANATRDATDNATYNDVVYDVCLMFGVELPSAVSLIKSWHEVYQGGNMWSAWDCYLTAARDILGLLLPEHKKYKYWESASKLGGFRHMHPKFCMVCDFPDVLKIDENNEPHCEDGPSHRWSDGWSLWHIHGVAVDEQIIMRPETQTISQINSEPNQDVRSIRIERFGWTRYIKESGAKLIDSVKSNPISGTPEQLYRLADGSQRLVAGCVTGKIVTMGVPSEIESCQQAQAWLAGGNKWNLLAAT